MKKLIGTLCISLGFVTQAFAGIKCTLVVNGAETSADIVEARDSSTAKIPNGQYTAEIVALDYAPGANGPERILNGTVVNNAGESVLGVVSILSSEAPASRTIMVMAKDGQNLITLGCDYKL